jgi:predicted SprT family Zn-dependent metalloprotease
MKKLNELAIECMAELDEIGIQYGNVVKWEINTRAKKRWGLCTRLPNGNYVISISNRLLEDNVAEQSAKDTIIHELLHTVKGCMNHKAEWKYQADKVNRAYGYNIKRCTSYEEKGIERPEATPREIKHKFVCKDCGKVYTRTKESKFTKNWQRYRCGVCGGEFTKEF